MIFYGYYICFFFIFPLIFTTTVPWCTAQHTHTHTLHYATEYNIYIEYYLHNLYRARLRQTDDCRNRLEEKLLYTYNNTSLCVWARHTTFTVRNGFSCISFPWGDHARWRPRWQKPPYWPDIVPETAPEHTIYLLCIIYIPTIYSSSCQL